MIDIKSQKINIQYLKKDSQKPTIVFLHEALGSVAQWRDFPQKVGDITGFNVLIFDRFGHGLSDPFLEKRGEDYLHKEAWDITPSVLQHFHIENPILFGHSDGGTIALLYASKFPTRALITVAAHVFVENETLSGIRQALFKKDFFIERLKKYHGEKSKDLFEAWANTWLDPQFQDWNITAILPYITCPALIIQGENDEYATPQHLDVIAKGIGKNAEKWLVSHCEHAPHKEKGELVLNKIAGFLKRIL